MIATDVNNENSLDKLYGYINDCDELTKYFNDYKKLDNNLGDEATTDPNEFVVDNLLEQLF